MIKTFKTKEPITVDPRTQLQEYAYFDIQYVMFDGETYKGEVNYYYIHDGIQVDMERVGAVFTVDEATLIEQSSGGLTGDNNTEKYLDLIIKATMYQLTAAGYFGLTGADWEIL